MSTTKNSIQSFFWPNFKSNLYDRRLWGILIVANLFGFPFVMLNFLYLQIGPIHILIAAVSFIIIAALGIIIPFIRFDYYYQKTKMDIAYSLPLTRKQKFLSDYFSGLVQYVAPYFLQFILSSIMVVLYMNQEKGFGKFYMLFGKIMDTESNRIFLTKWFQLMVFLLVIMIFIYTITCFILTCTGTLLEALFATFYVNLFLFTDVWLVGALMSRQLYGAIIEVSISKLVSILSPVGGLVEGYERIAYSFPPWLFETLIVIVILFVGTLFLSIHRSVENVGTPYVYRGIYYFGLISMMLHIYLICITVCSGIVGFFIASIFAYFIVELIASRGRRQWKKSIFRYVIIVGIVFMIGIVLDKTDCFGISYKVAEANDVDRINVAYRPIFSGEYDAVFEIRNKRNIEKILEVQRENIARYQKGQRDSGLFGDGDVYDREYQPTQSVRLMIYKGPKVISREYQFYYEDMIKLVEVELSEEGIEQRISQMKEQGDVIDFSDSFELNWVRLTDHDFVTQFLNELKLDLSETYLTEYLRPESASNYIAHIGKVRIPILSSYNHVLKFMEDSSFQLPDMVEVNKLLRSHEISIDSGWMDYNESFMELLQVAQVQYYSDRPCHKLYVDENVYIIPPEYNKVVEEVVERFGLIDSEYYRIR